MAVEIRTDPTFLPGAQEFLFPDKAYRKHISHPTYDVSLNDDRFLMVRRTFQVASHVIVVQNFFEELRDRVGR